MRFAVVQLNTRDDKEANVTTALALAGRAAEAGADLVALPESVPWYGGLERAACFAEPIPGPTVEGFAAIARQHRIHLLLGSLHERVAGRERPFNTSVLLDPAGGVAATYRKIHLFDAPGLELESAHVSAGSETVVARTEVGRLGLSVCYDLRFPELYRVLSDQGAEVLLVPSAFTLQTGRDHWETLLRARAIENLAYVVAPNQWGPHPPDKRSYGHSMIVDPWGTLLCRVPDGEGFACAEVDLQRVARARGRLQVLRHRRLGPACGGDQAGRSS